MAEPRTFTTGQAAVWLGVSQSSVIRWSREGIVMPSRHTHGEHRRYNENDMIALALARDAIERRMDQAWVKEMVRMVQRANMAELKKAFVVTVSGKTPGFAITVWLRDATDPKRTTQLARELAAQGFEELARTSLWEAVQKHRMALLDFGGRRAPRKH